MVRCLADLALNVELRSYNSMSCKLYRHIIRTFFLMAFAGTMVTDVVRRKRKKKTSTVTSWWVDFQICRGSRNTNKLPKKRIRVFSYFTWHEHTKPWATNAYQKLAGIMIFLWNDLYLATHYDIHERAALCLAPYLQIWCGTRTQTMRALSMYIAHLYSKGIPNLIVADWQINCNSKSIRYDACL